VAHALCVPCRDSPGTLWSAATALDLHRIAQKRTNRGELAKENRAADNAFWLLYRRSSAFIGG
jgi:hypothetical protein